MIKKFSSLTLCLFILLIHLNKSEAQEKIIKAIQVRQNRTVSSASILAKVRTKVGVSFSQATLNEDIKRLYATGLFSDIKVDLQEQAEGLVITFIITEKPILTETHFQGNHVFREARLRSVLKSKANAALDRKQLMDDLVELENLYKKKGYARVNIQHEIVQDEQTANAKLYVTIEEGPQSRIREVAFVGNEHYSRKRLMKYVRTRKDTLWTSGFLKPEEVRQDVERLRAFYEEEGYLDVHAQEEIDESNEGKTLVLTFHIEEGQRYFVGDITIQGNALYPETELRKLITLERDRPFSREDLRQGLNGIKEFYYDRGHIFAQIDAQTLADQDKIHVTIQITENSLAYVSKVHIRGNTKTKDIVIRRELKIKPGERYDGSKIRRSKERLYNLGFFEEVSFDTEPGPEPDKRDLVVTVKEAKTGEFSFGAGFSSVDKLMGFIEVAQNNFDLTNPPAFTGDGQRLAVRTSVGTIRRDYELSFTEPWIFDYPLLFGFDLYNRTHLRESDIGFGYDEERRGGALRLGKEFKEYLRGDWTYRLERVEISDVSSDATQDLQAEIGANTISSLTSALTWDRRDSVFSPTQGYVMSSSLETAGGFLGADKDFIKSITSGGVYFSPWQKWVLSAQLRVGWASEFGDTDDVPIYERFFAGGANTIRGYRERHIGPRDPNTNDPIGGKAMIIGNLEYTFPIVELLKGAIFYDAGNVWRRSGDIGSGEYRQGAGLGMRVKTPIGPVKVDWGYPINPPSGERKSGRFHFNISRGF